MRNIKILSEGSTCEVCGRKFATEEAKERHRGTHIRSARKRGLEPSFLHNPKTGKSIFKGFKIEGL